MAYQKFEAKDKISCPPVDNQKLDDIIDRLYTTKYEAMKNDPQKRPKLKNTVAGNAASEEEKKEIYDRLFSSHTKSSSGGIGCREYDKPLPQGLGQKLLPVIDGIEKRFFGDRPKEVGDEAMARLLVTQTKASQARLDNPRILLYPERTTLMNDVEKIKAYQATGAVARQTVLQRREKWFN